MVHTKLKELDETVFDWLAELVNVVGGAAEAKCCHDDGKPMDPGPPSVVRGKHYKGEYPSKAHRLDIPFKSDLGSFNPCVTFEFNGQKK